ncbi:pentapeptide repeat-containing protein [Planobispora siamensis]|uniref:Pentapeptide repeat-containing protein n=1 Tax=Planobispora siamensis TaxID=936338 RepID=A0A8J3WI06_9ACTN|nr:pentapeptide repeat-containing protein [Planobispora siamensis]GIH89990.1 hypothetical protein Psi01_06200 [Planobispora siamensis]
MPSRPSGTDSARPKAPAAPKDPVVPKIPAALTPAEVPRHDLDDDTAYRSAEFRSADLSDRHVDGLDIEGCRLLDTRFSGTAMRRASLSDVELERCDLSNMTARASTMHRARVSASRLTGMSWSECSFRDVVFDGCRADLTGFRFSTFENAVFRDCAMPEANFQNADLRGVRFEHCDLTGAQFSGARMEGARFADCILLRINGVTSLRGVIIKGRDAQGLVYSLAGAMGITIED